MKIITETPRLLLREIEETDLNPIFEMDSDPEVHKYLGNNPVKDKAQIAQVISLLKQQYQENGIARWAVIEKQSGEFMGWSGLKLVKEETNGYINFYDLGYRFSRKYWGKGYATESAKAALEYGFLKMELPVIYAAAHVNNSASNAILTKLGFLYEGVFLYQEEMDKWYRLPKTRWLPGNSC